MSYALGAMRYALEALHVAHRERHRTEFLLDLTAEQKWSGIEEHVAAAAVDVGKEHRLDETRAIVEGGELHRLVLDRGDRLGGGEHAGAEDAAAHVLVQLGGADDGIAAQLFAEQGHR